MIVNIIKYSIYLILSSNVCKQVSLKQKHFHKQA